MNNIPLVFISIPGLRSKDIDMMPNLCRWMSSGEKVPLAASFPAVTWPVQANMLTGCLPKDHGVIANGFYWRESHEVEMWTAWNEKIQRPQVWDSLHTGVDPKSSAVWFPMLSKGCGADSICMPAPIHNPNGTESLWCYTKPIQLYGELFEKFGHFPLKNFWGPLAGIPSSEWIAKTAAYAIQSLRPDFFYIYIPHLDYAAQKLGPDSSAALKAVAELDTLLNSFFDEAMSAYDSQGMNAIVVSEYVITQVDHVLYPNRILREAGLLKVCPESEGSGEQIDRIASEAWALVDHQFCHIFVKNADLKIISRVADLFAHQTGVQEVLHGPKLADYGMNHPRSGECVVISQPNSWQAYYWWTDDTKAPSYARTVDIHRKPGYDPVELHFDPVNRCIPLDAGLIRGSHGAPPRSSDQIGVAVCNHSGLLGVESLIDTQMYRKILSALGR